MLFLSSDDPHCQEMKNKWEHFGNNCANAPNLHWLQCQRDVIVTVVVITLPQVTVCFRRPTSSKLVLSSCSFAFWTQLNISYLTSHQLITCDNCVYHHSNAYHLSRTVFISDVIYRQDQSNLLICLWEESISQIWPVSWSDKLTIPMDRQPGAD